MAQFIGRGHDVECYGDSPELLGGKIGDDEFRAVGQHEGDLVTFAETEISAMMCQGVDGAVQFLIGHPAFVMDKGVITGVSLRGFL